MTSIEDLPSTITHGVIHVGVTVNDINVDNDIYVINDDNMNNVTLNVQPKDLEKLPDIELHNDVATDDIQKSDIQKNDVLKSDIQKNDIQKNDVLKIDIPKNDISLSNFGRLKFVNVNNPASANAKVLKNILSILVIKGQTASDMQSTIAKRLNVEHKTKLKNENIKISWSLKPMDVVLTTLLQNSKEHNAVIPFEILDNVICNNDVKTTVNTTVDTSDDELKIKKRKCDLDECLEEIEQIGTLLGRLQKKVRDLA